MPKKLRHRNRRKAPRINTLVVCRQPVRRGLDLDVLDLLKNTEQTFYLLRDAATTPFNVSADVERAAVQHYLQYLSMLVDVAASAIVALDIHNLPRAASMFQRMLLEYAVKADYYDRFPTYAHWALTIGEAEDYMKRLEHGMADQTELDLAKRALSKATIENPQLEAAASAARPPFKAVSVSHMFHEVADKALHTWSYRTPSIFIHGDPIGRRELFELTDEGMKGNIQFDNKRVNSDLVDTAGYFLTFCRTYQRNFAILLTNEIDSTLSALEQRLIRLALRYPEGRDVAYLDAAIYQEDADVVPTAR